MAALFLAMALVLTMYSVKPQEPQASLTRDWNFFVASIDEENQLLLDLNENYKKFHPQMTLSEAQYRQSQRKRRLQQWARVKELHQERLKLIEKIMKAEEKF
jgi:hypothetical protein